MKTCHDAAPSDFGPFDLITSSDCSLTVHEAPVSVEVPPFEPSFEAMDAMDAPHSVLGEMPDYELGEFLSEAFGEHDAEECV